MFRRRHSTTPESAAAAAAAAAAASANKLDSKEELDSSSVASKTLQPPSVSTSLSSLQESEPDLEFADTLAEIESRLRKLRTLHSKSVADGRADHSLVAGLKAKHAAEMEELSAVIENQHEIIKALEVELKLLRRRSTDNASIEYNEGEMNRKKSIRKDRRNAEKEYQAIMLDLKDFVDREDNVSSFPAEEETKARRSIKYDQLTASGAMSKTVDRLVRLQPKLFGEEGSQIRRKRRERSFDANTKLATFNDDDQPSPAVDEPPRLRSGSLGSYSDLLRRTSSGSQAIPSDGSADLRDKLVDDMDFETHQLDTAARVIQRWYRYYTVRKRFMAMVDRAKVRQTVCTPIDEIRRLGSRRALLLNQDSVEKIENPSGELNQKFLAAIYEFNRKPALGLSLLVNLGFVEDTDEAIADFLRTEKRLNNVKVGDYLGSSDPDIVPIRDAFTRSVDFKGLDFDLALRKFLVDSNFRVGGEAQVIDRMMESFGRIFYEATIESKVFANPDAAYILAFSTLMLNTDAHNPNVRNRMTEAQFVRNNRGINDGGDLPLEYLKKLYSSIVNNEIRMRAEDPLGPIVEHFEAPLPELKEECRQHLFMFRADEIQDILIQHPARLSRNIHVFNDCVLLCKSNKRKREEFRSLMSMARLKCTDVKDSGWHQNVVDVSNGSGRLLYLSFSSLADKQSFMSLIREQAHIMSHVQKPVIDKLQAFITDLSKRAAIVVEPKLVTEHRTDSRSAFRKFAMRAGLFRVKSSSSSHSMESNELIVEVDPGEGSDTDDTSTISSVSSISSTHSASHIRSSVPAGSMTLGRHGIHSAMELEKATSSDSLTRMQTLPTRRKPARDEETL